MNLVLRGVAPDPAAAVVRLMDHPDLAAQLGEAGRAWVTRERTWASNGPRWTAVYEAVLAGHRDRRPPASDT